MRQDLPIEVKSCRWVVGDADPYAVSQKKKAPAVAGAFKVLVHRGEPRSPAVPKGRKTLPQSVSRATEGRPYDLRFSR